MEAEGWGLGRVPCVQRRLPGTRCRYLPLSLSQHHHGNAGPAGCSWGTSPITAATVTATSSQGAGAEGQLFLTSLRAELKDPDAHLLPSVSLSVS